MHPDKGFHLDAFGGLSTCLYFLAKVCNSKRRDNQEEV